MPSRPLFFIELVFGSSAIWVGVLAPASGRVVTASRKLMTFMMLRFGESSRPPASILTFVLFVPFLAHAVFSHEFSARATTPAPAPAHGPNSTGPAPAPPPVPTQGWCKTRHRPQRAAQSGYDGYCKPCYKKFFPEQHAAKQTHRKLSCSYCGESREVSMDGFCKPCKRARSCDKCEEVNADSSAVGCVTCATQRAAEGAKQTRLALWCRACTSESERASGKCRACYDKMV